MRYKLGIFKVVVVARATHPPEGMRENQALAALPIVWGWHLRAQFESRPATGDGMGQSRWPPWCIRNHIYQLHTYTKGEV